MMHALWLLHVTKGTSRDKAASSSYTCMKALVSQSVSIQFVKFIETWWSSLELI